MSINPNSPENSLPCEPTEEETLKVQSVSTNETAPAPVKSRGVCLPAAIADGLARHHAQEQQFYRKKLKGVKSLIRNIVLENAALNDVVASTQEDIALAMEERQYLLRKVIQLQVNNEHNSQNSSVKSNRSGLESDKQTLRRYWQEDKKPSWSHQTSKPLTSSKKKSSGSTINVSKNLPAIINKEKSRSKKPPKQAKKKCPPIPLDSSGRPIFPLVLGRLTIHSLGEIISEKKLFHTEKMIYPVGFCSSRLYASLKNPQKQTLYTCTIKEGHTGPRFDIVCDEDETTFVGNTPSECHSEILKKINMILGIDLLPVVPTTKEAEERGLRFFGLSHPSVHNMLQACPGARKCSKYKWIQFEVCKSEAEADGVSEPEREASICHETLLRNIRFASNHM